MWFIGIVETTNLEDLLRDFKGCSDFEIEGRSLRVIEGRKDMFVLEDDWINVLLV